MQQRTFLYPKLDTEKQNCLIINFTIEILPNCCPKNGSPNLHSYQQCRTYAFLVLVPKYIYYQLFSNNLGEKMHLL